MAKPKTSKDSKGAASAPADRAYDRYLSEIDLYDQKSSQFRTRGRKIVKRYLDEREETTRHDTKFNILWSNTETLLPACYAKTPVPIVERRNKDKDPVARWASEIVERELSYFMDCGGFNYIIEQAVIDKLLPGRGTCWVRYCPKFRPLQVAGNDDYDGDEGAGAAEEVYDEEAKVDYVHWEDFGHNICRSYDEVWMMYRIVYLTRDELINRFGKELGGQIPLDWNPASDIKDTDVAVDKKARIYEIWDKSAQQAAWLSKGVPRLLDTKADPLKLPGFFPSPRPMFATLANRTLLPVAYYSEYQDQARELDNLTARIAMITKALKVAGVYDVSAQGLQRLLNEGTENMLVPVDKYGALKDKGGIGGAMELWPVDQIADTLLKLYQARDQVKQDLYEISGMPDIIRGSSDPQETASAQRIKGQFGSMRLRKMQDDVQRYCRDVLVLMGSIIANQFSWETHRAISGVTLLSNAEKAQVQLMMAPPAAALPGTPPPPAPPPIPPQVQELMSEPSWEDVEAFLKDKMNRGFRIDIETDSTIGADDEVEKQQRLQFLQTAQQLIGQATEAGQSQPALAPLLIEMVMFGLRPFKSGRTLEGAIENALDALKAQAGQPQPDKDAQKLQAEQAQAQAELQGKMQLEQMRIQGDKDNTQAKIQADAALAQHNATLQNQLEASKQSFQAAQAQQETSLEAQRNAEQRNNEMALAQFKLEKEMELAKYKADLAYQQAIEVAKINAGAKVEASLVAGVKQAQGGQPFVDENEQGVQ